MDAIDIIIIMIGFTLLFVLLFIEAHVSAVNKTVEKDTSLRKTYFTNPRRFSLYCATAATIGVAMMIAPAISFFFENSTVYGVIAIAMLLIGAPGGAIRTYQKFVSFSPSKS